MMGTTNGQTQPGGNWLTGSLSRKIVLTVWISMIAVGAGRLIVAGLIGEGTQNLTQAIVLEAISEVVNAMIIMMVVSLIATRVVTRLTGVMGRLAEGELHTKIPDTERLDEFGAMARALRVFRETATEAENLRVTQETDRMLAEERLKEEMLALSDTLDEAVKSTVTSVVERSAEMNDMATTMNDVVGRVSGTASEVADMARATTDNVEAMAAKSEELNASGNEIGKEVQQSNAIAGKAAQEVAETDGTVRTLDEAAGKISEVVGLINDIAEQTNLLALNATIEAARAGDAGKGFAVVAHEVKNLANQTAKATEEIGQQVSAMQEATRDAVAAISSIGKVITEMNEIAGRVSGGISEQGSATQDIAANVAEAATGTRAVSSGMEDVSDGTGQVGELSGQVRAAADEVAGMVHDMQENLTRIVRESIAGNRRREDRREIEAHAKLKAANTWRAGDIRDLSRSGAGVEGDLALAEGAEVRLEVPNVGEVSGTVRHAGKGHTGIEFHADAGTQRRLEEIVR
jgi:methyl-accepting chemotaxis protein